MGRHSNYNNVILSAVYSFISEEALLDDAVGLYVFAFKVKLTLNTQSFGLNWQGSDGYRVEYKEEGRESWDLDPNFQYCPYNCTKYLSLQPGTNYTIRVRRHVRGRNIYTTETFIQIKTGTLSRYIIINFMTKF